MLFILIAEKEHKEVRSYTALNRLITNQKSGSFLQPLLKTVSFSLTGVEYLECYLTPMLQ